MNRWQRHQGNVNDVIVVGLLGVGAAAGVDDLSTVNAIHATVQFAALTPVTLTAVVSDAPNSEATVSLGTWLSGSPALGCWKLRYFLTFSNGKGPLAWPEDPVGSPGWDEIEVIPAA